ncbi:hypothetical protein FQN53_005984 [Emmonsiellopsis sp. PD_33]|nr:hypothetical protein FQN53_005984 [Emmonsiellopsis sp. PD_33]
MERTPAEDEPSREHPLKNDADECISRFNKLKDHARLQDRIKAELAHFEDWARNMKVSEEVSGTPYPGWRKLASQDLTELFKKLLRSLQTELESFPGLE